MNVEEMLQAAKERRARMWGERPNLVERELVRPTMPPPPRPPAPPRARRKKPVATPEAQRDWLLRIDVRTFGDLSSRDRARYFLKLCADHHGMTIEALLGYTRTAAVMLARQEAMYLTAKYTRLSLPQIGRLFNRDHSTVCHAIGRMDELFGTTVRSDRLAPLVEPGA